MSAILRQAVRSDLSDLFRVRHAASENRPASLTIPEAQVIQALETTGRGWVIELDGVVVAFALGDALTGSIWALFVDPLHRGRGYGRRLHDTVVDWLWSQENDRMLRAWDRGIQKAGFSEHDRRAPARRNGESRLLAKRRSAPRVRRRKEKSHA